MLPDESILVERIEIKPGKRGAMPPAGQGDPCSPKQIALIREWIKQGAKTGDWQGYQSQNKHISPKTSETTPLSPINNMGKMIKIRG